MNDWIKRHIALTREEQLLIGGILVILLCGLGVRHYRNSDTTANSNRSTVTVDSVSR